MKRDELFIAALIAGLSTLAGEAVTKILVLTGVGQYSVFELNSLVVTNDRPSMLMGFILNFIVGSQAGVLFYLLFKRLGNRHLVLKCILGSLPLWLIFELVFTALIEGKSIPERSLADHYVHITGTAVFGLTVGIFMRMILFKKEPQSDQS